MRKRLLSIVLTLGLLAVLVPCLKLTAWAAKSDTDIAYAVEGGNIYFDPSTYTITDCDRSVTAANIPAVIGSTTVKTIGENAFVHASNMTSVTIPGTVTAIEDYAFYGCDKLPSITIPDSVTSIGSYVFASCDVLTSVNLSNGLISIGTQWFYYSDNVTSITIPASVSTIANGAFTDGKGLTRIQVAEGNPYFSNDDTGILFNKDKSILLQAPSGLTGSYSVPNTVKRIEDGAFWCSELTSVTIPDGVTAIGDQAFYYSMLAEVTIPASVTTIGEEAFRETELTKVDIPNGVTTIGPYAFRYCYNLTEVDLSASVTSLGKCAFSGCPELTGIWVAEGNPNYCSDANGALYNKAKTDLIQFPAAISGVYRIPYGVTIIHDSAFEDSRLSEVDIPNSVTTIEPGAFQYAALRGVTIPDSVTSIGEEAFRHCEQLTSVSLSNNLTTIEYGVFRECACLTSITIPTSVTTIKSHAFEYCYRLYEVIMGSNVSEIYGYAFDTCPRLVSVGFLGDAPAIGSPGFFNDPTLYFIPGKSGWTSPTWNGYSTATWDGVNLYASYAAYPVQGGNIHFDKTDGTIFDADAGVTSASIPAQIDGIPVLCIDDFAFYNAKNLTKVVIPETVTRIDECAFYGLENLKGVYFYGNAPLVGEYAFMMYDEALEDDANIPGLTLYYLKDKTGWSSPTWNGYPTATWGGNSFSDVKSEDWFYSYVRQAAELGLVNGYVDNTFRPSGQLTRAEAATLMYRIAGSPAVSGKASFQDLPDDWYQDAIYWAQSTGVVNGVSATKFQPGANITREAFITMIWRSAGRPTSGASLSGFADTNKVDDWAVTAFAWAVEKGIINGTPMPGKSGLYLAPLNNITRAEAAKILVVFTQ